MLKPPKSISRSPYMLKSIQTPQFQKKRQYNSARFASLQPLEKNESQKSPGSLKRTDSIPIPIVEVSENQIEEVKEIKDIDFEPVADESIPLNFQSISGANTRNSSCISFDLNFDFPPPIPKIKSSNFSEILSRKIKLCNYICDFYNPEIDVKFKDEKKKGLEEILHIVSKNDYITRMRSDQITDIIGMCKNNIVRDLPILHAHQIFSEDLPPITEPAWPHISLVYQILIFIFQKYSQLPIFSTNFLMDFLPIMQSPDVNERQVLNGFIIDFIKSRDEKSSTNSKSVNVVLLSQLYKLLANHIESNTLPFIVGPILQIYLHVFQSSFHNKNITFQIYSQLLRLLSDLHFSVFEEPYYAIVDFFSDESSAFALMLIRSLILYWPKTCAEKEASFVHMLLHAMPKLSSRNLSPLIPRIFSNLANCIASPSLKVAEETFKIWTSRAIESIIVEHSNKIVFLTYENVLLGSKNHWSKNIRMNLLTVLKLMQKFSPSAVKQVSNNQRIMAYASIRQDETLKQLTDVKQVMKKDGTSKWASIARMAASNDKQINLGKKLSEITMLYNGNLKFMKKTIK